MTHLTSARALVAIALGVLSVSARAAGQQPAAGGSPSMSPTARAAADSGRPPYTKEDVAFLSGMIAHHAQAVLISGWAPSHGASSSVQVLCERIVVAQRDEIAAMQRWLRERGQPVPDGDPAKQDMSAMPGMQMTLMPGMLTADQLKQLNAARGQEFDRLFLTFMIQHHRGALTMVNALFESPGAMEDDLLYKIASDVSADQSSEIDRMTKMLAALPPASKGP